MRIRQFVAGPVLALGVLAAAAAPAVLPVAAAPAVPISAASAVVPAAAAAPAVSTSAATAAPAVVALSPSRLAAAHHSSFNSHNWAGWVTYGGHYYSVSAAFRVPKVTCSSAFTVAVFWAGLDGIGSSKTVEQTGVAADCYKGHAEYAAWTEYYPAAPKYYSNAVHAGDSISVSVVAHKDHRYTTYMADHTRHWSRTASATDKNGKNLSAEVIAEAPLHGTTTKPYPLAHFSPVRFADAIVSHKRIGNVSPLYQAQMTDTHGHRKATTSGLTDKKAFTVTWRRSS